jgi:Tfp pilus assembly protein PilO
MSGRESIWRLRLWVWLPALLFFLANAAAFTVYRLGYAGTVQSLEEDLEEEKGELQKQALERHRLEGLLSKAETNRRQIHSEVKTLARQAGLSFRSIEYPQQEIEDFNLIKRSFSFAVQGTYPQLRQFINLLEQSDSFLILEEMTLSQGNEEDSRLRISLTLSTMFEDRNRSTAVPPASRALQATAGQVGGAP